MSPQNKMCSDLMKTVRKACLNYPINFVSSHIEIKHKSKGSSEYGAFPVTDMEFWGGVIFIHLYFIKLHAPRVACPKDRSEVAKKLLLLILHENHSSSQFHTGYGSQRSILMPLKSRLVV